jgi:hypothetical protein
MMTEEQQPLMVVKIDGIEYPVWKLLPEEQAREFLKLLDKVEKNKHNPRKSQKPLAKLVMAGFSIITTCLRMTEQQVGETPGTTLNHLLSQILLASLGNANLS